MTEKMSTWLTRTVIAVFLAACVTFVAGGLTLSERVANIAARQVEKADRIYVDAKFDAVLRDTETIKQMLRDHAAQTARLR